MIALETAVAHLKSGGIVAYPTETFYGLGVDAENQNALIRLTNVKGREETKPFPLLLPNTASLDRFVDNIPKQARELTQQFWPGPLTLIFSSTHFHSPVRSASGGVGFRVSTHPLATQFVQAFQKCVTTTSANRAGKPPASTPKEVAAYFSSQDVLILDGGKTNGGPPSTVVDLVGKAPKLIREGAIAWKDIEDKWQR